MFFQPFYWLVSPGDQNSYWNSLLILSWYWFKIIYLISYSVLRKETYLRGRFRSRLCSRHKDAEQSHDDQVNFIDGTTLILLGHILQKNNMDSVKPKNKAGFIRMGPWLPSCACQARQWAVQAGHPRRPYPSHPRHPGQRSTWGWPACKVLLGLHPHCGAEKGAEASAPGA